MCFDLRNFFLFSLILNFTIWSICGGGVSGVSTLLEKGSVGGVQMAIFLKGLSEKFSSSRKSKCSRSNDEVWEKAFVFAFHCDPSYLHRSSLDSILVSHVLSVPVRTASEAFRWDQILPAPPFYSRDSPPGFPLDSPTSVQILRIPAFAFFPSPTSHPIPPL